jgi:hypothetical protein
MDLEGLDSFTLARIAQKVGAGEPTSPERRAGRSPDLTALANITTSTGNLLAAEKTANAILEVAALRPQNALQVRRD